MDEDDKELGRLMQINMSEGLEGFSMALFTRILGWSAQEVKELLVDVEKDIKNTDYHIYSLRYVGFFLFPCLAIILFNLVEWFFEGC